MIFIRALFSFVAFIAFVSPLKADESATVVFHAISDIPYSDSQEKLLEDTIIPALLAAQSPFLIHMGDIKGGGAACTDDVMKTRHGQIMRMHSDFVFFTPGDNDWTDCDRKKTGHPVSELESLDKLRRLFYANEPDYPESWHVARQALYPENKRWTYKKISFATLHLVGTNNGRIQIKKDDKSFALSQVTARDKANKVWLRTLFQVAEDNQTNAIVIAVQADVTDNRYNDKCTREEPADCDGFYKFKKQLRKAAADFNKPVLLLHGDTSAYCMDRQFGGEKASKLWRFNSAGDYKVLDAVKITVQPSNPDTPFKMESLREGIAPEERC
ncbi:MAG: hypothetical protein JKX94_10675 [Sneathiella sp.]|nr:hypothetical protein [Sneathiella sp.]